MLHVKKIREKLGVTKYMLRKKTGLSMTTITDVENGVDVRVSTLYKIADALGVKVTDLFEEGQQ